MALSIIGSTNEHTLSEASAISRHFASCVPHDVTYIGLASLLPQEDQALYSCAGLFYVQVLDVCVGGDLYRVEIAALPRYFSADQRSYQRHVRTIFLTEGQCAQLVEWDRRLAAMATCDVRDLVEAHIMQVQATHRLPQSDEVPTRECGAVSAHPHEDTQSPTVVHHDEKQEEYVDGPTVTLSVDTVQDIWSKLQPRRARSLRQLPVLLLRAALSVAEPLEQALIRRVLVWRDRIPPQMEVTPIFARGHTGQQIVGYRVEVRVLRAFAA
jgi:hypothetical protein